jgi:hypothetical protein
LRQPFDRARLDAQHLGGTVEEKLRPVVLCGQRRVARVRERGKVALEPTRRA